MQIWRARAEAIPDETLRRVALDAQHVKRGNLEGAVAFAVLAQREHRLGSARAMAAYEAAFDYLDCLCEMPNANPIANGRQLTQALIVAVQPGLEHADYYAHHTLNEDGGYLRALVNVCQREIGLLPAFPVVRDGLVQVSSRITEYQSFNHGDAEGSHDEFTHWAVAEAARYHREHDGPTLHWWEIGAAGGSSLAAFALIAAATDPYIRSRQAAAIADTYFPWIGAANSLLDSLIDQREDDRPGQHRLLDYYVTPEQVRDRLGMIVKHAMLRAHELKPRPGHALIAAAMTSFYLSSPEANAPDLTQIRNSLLNSMGVYESPTMLVMRARRIVGRLSL
jgi:tetraprenyl-beta-curcumene synthase